MNQFPPLWLSKNILIRRPPVGSSRNTYALKNSIHAARRLLNRLLLRKRRIQRRQQINQQQNPQNRKYRLQRKLSQEEPSFRHTHVERAHRIHPVLRRTLKDT